MNRFLETYNHSKLNQRDINHLSRPITQKEIEAAMKILPKKKSPGPEEFTAEFYHTFKEVLIPTLFNLFHEIERKENCQTHFMKPILRSSQNQTKTSPKRKATGQFP
jgi:hypothetical protein